MQNKLFIYVLIFLIASKSIAQKDSIELKNTKLKKTILASGSAVLTIGSLVTLNQAWYSSYNTGQFHFFNDDKEWLQMDKVGHVYSNFQMARLMMGAYKWAGFNKNEQLIYGGSLGFVYMTAIECMDGFSKGWGFSWGDELANALGTGFAITQNALWDKQKFNLKFSFTPSGLAKYNPSLLGKNFGNQILKDYNGQTYWLTFNPFAFTKKQSKFPKWLNLAIGYSAYGMIGGHENKIVVLDNNGNAIKFNRERRCYLSLDVDLTEINVKNKILKKALSMLNIIKIPAPAIEFNNKGLKFYYFYY